MTCPKCGTENFSWRSRCQHCGERLHPEDATLPPLKNKISPSVIFIPFILSLLATGILIFFVSFEYYLSIRSIPILYYCLLVFPAAGLIMCWIRPRVGGVLLILTGLFPIGLMLIEGVSWKVSSALFFLGPTCLPLLASGIFLIIIDRK